MTTDIAPKWFAGYDLGYYGLVVNGVAGVHDLAETKVARTWVEGRDWPHEQTVYRDLVGVTLKCVLAKDTNEELVDTLRTIRGIVDSASGYCELRVPDRPGERTLAKSIRFGISEDSLPFDQTVATWNWQLERYGWWEDLTERVVTLGAVTSGSIVNSGRLVAYPTYTCTATAALASGLDFTVGGVKFQYDGPIDNGEVLVVTTDLPDVTLEGTRDYANTASPPRFPTLAAGTNAVTKSSVNYTLAAAFRRRNP